MLRFIVVITCISYTRGDYLQLDEGSPCTWKGVDGKCVKIHKCLSTILDVKNKDHPPICSFNEKTPIICCTDCTLVNDTRLIIFDPQLGKLTKTGNNQARDTMDSYIIKCIDYTHALDYPCKFTRASFWKSLDKEKKCHKVSISVSSIISGGGRNAKRDEFPHMALLGYGKTFETAQWLCGGSVISERFILTAAHCLSGPSTGPVKYIALGILKRSDPKELWQTYNVKRAISHPRYKPPSKYHDIALLETEREIEFFSIDEDGKNDFTRSEIRPACLHTDDKIDSKAFATGWGALGHKKELADVLQSVSLHRFSEEECSEYYPTHRLLKNGFDRTTQMCYGDRNDTDIPTDTCEGDSGGPLQSYDHEQCVMTIIGVTSFGRQCSMSGGSGIYTRVSFYVPWIEGIVWPTT